MVLRSDRSLILFVRSHPGSCSLPLPGWVSVPPWRIGGGLLFTGAALRPMNSYARQNPLHRVHSVTRLQQRSGSHTAHIGSLLDLIDHQAQLHQGFFSGSQGGCGPGAPGMFLLLFQQIVIAPCGEGMEMIVNALLDYRFRLETVLK